MKFHPVKFAEAFWFQEGPGVRNWQFTDHGVKLLNVANILKTGVIDLSKTDRHLALEEVQARYSHFLADEGDLVIASSGITIDEDGFLRTRGAFLEKHHLPLCINTSTIRFKALDGISDLGFLKYWLQSFEFRSQITREVTGIAQKNFGPSHLKRLTISLPPLGEQKRIAAILDAADALRAKRRETLAQLDTLLQSTFLDMFGDPVTNPMGWEVQPLKELGQVQTGSTPPSKLEGMFGGEVPFVTPGDLKDTWTNSSRTVTIAGAKKSRTVQRGATFVCCIGATIGKMGKAEKFSAFNQQINTVTWGPRIDDGFGLEMMKFFKEKIATDGASTTLPILKKSLFEKIIVLAPPLPLQRRFATIVESVEQQKTRLRAHLTELDILFASLQDRAFKGAL